MDDGLFNYKQALRLPVSVVGTTKDSMVIEKGFDVVHNLTTLAKKHEHSSGQKCLFLRLYRMGQDRIDIGLSSARSEAIRKHNVEVNKNRKIMRRLIACVLFLARDELPFREHNESSENSGSRRNFKDLLEPIANFDPVMHEHLAQR